MIDIKEPLETVQPEKDAPEKEQVKFVPFAKKEGRRVKTLSPMTIVVPYIMETRNTASNLIRDSVDATALERYIREKQEQGLKNFGIMHCIIAAYVRVVAERPAINRYIRGQRIWARNNVEVVFVIKREMTLDAPDTTIKVAFDRTETAEEVYKMINTKIDDYRANPNSDFDNVAKLLTYLPGLIFRGTIHFLRFLDYFNLLPRFLTKISCFHASFFITSMGSLGIPPIYHHLYDFGTVPAFCSFGVKRRVYEPDRFGNIRRVPYLDFTFVTDERICDGYYYASALKLFKNILRNPWQLDAPPAQVLEDVK